MEDVLGNTLKVGDKVVFALPTYCCLQTGIVSKICAKTLVITPSDDGDEDFEKRLVNRHPNGVVKVK